MKGEDYVETTEEVFLHWLTEIPEDGYFMFQGMMVCLPGAIDRIRRNAKLTSDDVLFKGMIKEQAPNV